MTTGSIPTFIDLSSNFASYEINEDNIIDQLISHGRRVVFAGDDTWLSLFPNRFTRTYPFPSFDVWDLDTVDRGVERNLFRELERPDSWDVFIGKFTSTVIDISTLKKCRNVGTKLYILNLAKKNILLEKSQTLRWAIELVFTSSTR